MYTLERAYRRKDRRSGRWELFDVSTSKILTLQATHGEVRVVVSTPGLDAPVLKSFAWDAITPTLVNLTNTDLTFYQWLVSIGERTLPFDEKLFTFTSYYAQYMSAWSAGYKFEPINSAGTRTIGADLTDLRMSRADVDPTVLGQRALVSINGLYHRMDGGQNGCLVRGGMSSIRHSGENQIGLLAFSKVGRLQQIPITPDLVDVTDSGVYVGIPNNIDTTGKVPLFVLGGYLHAMDSVVRQLGDHLYKINIRNMRLLERYMESSKLLDLSSLPLDKYPAMQNNLLVDLKQFWSPEFIKAYLTLPQSFIVLVEAESLFHQLCPIDPLFPGRYLEVTTSYHPLMGVNGRGLEYTAQRQGHATVLCTCPNAQLNYDFAKRPYLQDGIVDDKLSIQSPAYNATAYLRKLGTER